MTRAANEAETGRPTVEQEMSVFKGFSTNNGETITPETPEDLNPVTGKNMTAAEIAAAKSKDDAKKPAEGAKPAAAPVKLTDAESDKVITDLDAKLGREATDAEIADALAAESAKKSGKSEPTKKTVQDRINKAVRAQRAAERRADTLAAELAEAKKAPLTADKKPANDAADAAPDPKKFEYGELDANYIRALARWEAKQEFAEQTNNQKKVALTAKEQADKDDFEAAKAVFEDTGAELFTDFDEVVMQGARDKAWLLSDTLGATLMVSEFGPQIAYELASNPKEAKRIFDMPPMRQVAWLGRKEAELESAGSGAKADDEGKEDKAAAKSDTKPKAAAQVSKAPTPIQRARGQGSASAVPGDTSDFAAFEAAAMGRPRN